MTNAHQPAETLAQDDARADDAARRRIRESLDETLFVEAGAGTGKTSALVDRVGALVTVGGEDGPIPMGSIAAITFTEKAAAELRDRVRKELEIAARDPESTADVVARCRDALDELDGAPISTLHAFAHRLLSEHPIEVRLPPRVTVLDEISSGVAFDERWSRFVDRLLEEPTLERTTLLAFAAGVKFARLRTAAEAFNGNWDIVAERVGAEAEPPPLDASSWLDDLDRVCRQRVACVDPDDRLVERMEELAAFVERVRAARDEVELLRILRTEMPSCKVGTRGQKANWKAGGVDIATLRAEIKAFEGSREALLNATVSAVVRRLAAEIAQFTLEEVEERRAAGELEFHDLLVLARALLRDPVHGSSVRARLRAKYRRILIDEFQDTDPIQIDLAVLLASAETPDGAVPWNALEVDPGRLFFVGDPKQSIYRFRRADIAVFLTARDRFAPDPVLLSRNWRSTAPVVEWVNGVFGELIKAVADSQPEYRGLGSVRTASPAGPSVVLLGRDAHADGPNADALREREAADVIAAIRTAVTERWQVGDGRDSDGNDGWRDVRLGDICILLPARTSLPFLERALDDAGIPYRAETSSLVYGTREVRDLLAVLRAVDDATDELSLVTALRSPYFGCGDDDLYTFHVEHHGRWNHRAPLPDSLPPDHPVGDAMRVLASLHEARTWLTPSELLERIVRDRHVLELGFATGRFREASRRVRFIVDQARAFSESTGGSLREYLAWAALQGAEGSRVVETVLPETDDDAVRILTIHGSKGLEFPVCIVSGMTTQAQGARSFVDVLFPPSGGYEIRLGAKVKTDDFDRHKPIDEQMGFDEKIRLLYVACTRGRDHLVVSTHRKDRALDPGDRSKWTHAELVWFAANEITLTAQLGVTTGNPVLLAATAVSPPLERGDWEAERARAMSSARARRFVSATAIARDAGGVGPGSDSTSTDPGLVKEGRDLELPPWNKGRYGTAIGRAVHAVLQTIDLRTGAGLAETAAAQAAAEGVIGREDQIAALARAALGSATVARACSSEFWREMYVAVPLEGVTLEGYVDLVYRGADGLVVVDYKTDAVGSDADIAAKMSHYRLQGAAYALAIAEATGEPVERCVFVFLDPAGAREIDVKDLAEAVEQVRRAAPVVAARGD